MVSRARRTRLLLAASCASSSLEASHAWAASRTPARKAAAAAGSVTAKFYKVGGEAFPASTPAAQTPSPCRTESLSALRRLPWTGLSGPFSAANDNVFLDHWNWQFSFFEEHLTNLRVREPGRDEGARELYYTKDGNKRIYTVSLESDEYRDIRISYVHCPSMQTFRCLCYPRDGDLPIMGMGIMRMAGSRNLSVLDYHPLPPRDEAGAEVNSMYTSELLNIRREFPSMSHSMTRRSFDSDEERVYFTELPLLGRCAEGEATPSEVEAYGRDLFQVHKRFAAKHVELTQFFGSHRFVPNHVELTYSFGKDRREAQDCPGYALERHSDFDTHLSEREPVGPFLRGVFGPDTGGKLVHGVIFPLSKHRANGEAKRVER